jgi:hypothetical protein
MQSTIVTFYFLGLRETQDVALLAPAITLFLQLLPERNHQTLMKKDVSTEVGAYGRRP